MKFTALAVLVMAAGAMAGEPAQWKGISRRAETYKTIGEVQLRLNIYEPPGHKASDKRPAIVFFFGGGWSAGTVMQFDRHSRYLATRGMVAVTADYRVRSRHGTTPFECVSDGKSAIRWVRANAKRLGVDPERIAAAGGSAGGHVAACTAFIEGLDEKTEDAAVSSKPNALVLFNPVIDTTTLGYGSQRLGARAREISPVHHVKPGAPPAVLFHGKADTTVPHENAVRFRDVMKKAGNRCELMSFEGQAHGFFNWGRSGNKAFVASVRRADEFLASLGYLKGPPTLELPQE